jgi:hypothetical protein
VTAGVFLLVWRRSHVGLTLGAIWLREDGRLEVVECLRLIPAEEVLAYCAWATPGASPS